MNKRTNDTLDELISKHKRRKKKTVIVLFLIICSIILLPIIIHPIKILENIDKNKFEDYNICNRDTFMDKFNYISNQQLAYYNIFDGTDENNRYYKDQLIYEDNINRKYNDFEEYMIGKGWKFKVEGWIHNDTTIVFEKEELYIKSYMHEIRSTDYYGFEWIYLNGNNDVWSYDDEEIEELNSDAEELLNSEENSTLKEFVVDINDYSEQGCSKLESKND